MWPYRLLTFYRYLVKYSHMIFIDIIILGNKNNEIQRLMIIFV